MRGEPGLQLGMDAVHQHPPVAAVHLAARLGRHRFARHLRRRAVALRQQVVGGALGDAVEAQREAAPARAGPPCGAGGTAGSASPRRSARRTISSRSRARAAGRQRRRHLAPPRARAGKEALHRPPARALRGWRSATPRQRQFQRVALLRDAAEQRPGLDARAEFGDAPVPGRFAAQGDEGLERPGRGERVGEGHGRLSSLRCVAARVPRPAPVKPYSDSRGRLLRNSWPATPRQRAQLRGSRAVPGRVRVLRAVAQQVVGQHAAPASPRPPARRGCRRRGRGGPWSRPRPPGRAGPRARRGVRIEEVGLTAKRATIGWPVEMPPRMPPAWLDRNAHAAVARPCASRRRSPRRTARRRRSRRRSRRP